MATETEDSVLETDGGVIGSQSAGNSVVSFKNSTKRADKSPIIIDNGSYSVKAGFENEEAPSVIVPTRVGKPRRRYSSYYEEGTCLVGSELVANRHYMSITNPIDHGHIEDWNDMNTLWDYTFRCLEAQVEEHPVLMTIPTLCSTRHKSTLAEIMFETYRVPELQIAVSGLLALFGSGKQTAFIVDIGEGVTQCIPVIEGHLETAACRRSDFAGEELTMYIQKILCDIGYPLTGRDDYEYCKKIKEEICFCSTDPNVDIQRDDLEHVYTLPDGELLRDGVTNQIQIGPERFFGAEALFNPQLCGRDNLKLTDLLWRSINACPISCRKQLCASVNLVGGTTLMNGFADRLQSELKYSAPEKARDNIKVISVDNADILSWIGGKVVCSSSIKSLSQRRWIDSEEWAETGPSILQQTIL